MKREIITTGDGSKTIHIPEWNEQYHSKHGAIQEARHVFLQTGLQHYVDVRGQNNDTPISILEIGFGTGLNALLTFYKARELKRTIRYVGVEAFPVVSEEAMEMEYANQLKDIGAKTIYESLHEASWEKSILISQEFELTKREQRFEEIIDTDSFDLIYFDAFGPRVQPELWTEAIFLKMYNALKSKGCLLYTSPSPRDKRQSRMPSSA